MQLRKHSLDETFSTLPSGGRNSRTQRKQAAFAPPLPRPRPNPAAANHRRQDRGAASAGGSFDNPCAAAAAAEELSDARRDQLGRRCGGVPAGSVVSPAAEPMRRLLASDGAPDLRYDIYVLLREPNKYLYHDSFLEFVTCLDPTRCTAIFLSRTGRELEHRHVFKTLQ